MDIKIERRARHIADYDIIVAGGGVAGVAAAVSAKRQGIEKVLIIEKTIGLGGLATTGVVNLFVAMCNGRGTQIIKGMAQELLHEAIKYGYDTLPDEWRNGEPEKGEKKRLESRFSPQIFTLVLTEFVKKSGVDILFDTIITEPVMEGSICKGVIVENKTGCEFYGAKAVIDTSGDADVLYRAGVPTINGKNYHTYSTIGVNLESCRKAADTNDIANLFTRKYRGGLADLHGNNQPADIPLRSGTTVREITDYIIENHIECLEKIKADDRKSREIVTLPTMPQFRETRRIDGDITLHETDAYKHFDDSIAVINDFERRDYLYEISFRALVRKGFPNLITAGRSISSDGYAWSLTRVIPPAILTGQAAGNAVAAALKENKAITDIDIKQLQKTLERQDVMIHFDDSLIPEYEQEDTMAVNEEHI